MKQVDTIRKGTPRRRRRRHSPQFKAQVIEACRVPGASVAAVGLEHGLNANLVRRWLKQALPGKTRAVALATKSPALESNGFVPVMVEATLPRAEAIRIEVRRGATTINIAWPTQAAGECAAWLREWLR